MGRMFTYDEMVGRSHDLLPLTKGRDSHPSIFVYDQHPDFQGDITGLLETVKKGSDIEIYQLCKLTTKALGSPVYFALSDFRETDTGWETSLHEAAKADKRNTYQAFREKNLPFLRMYMMGGQDIKIACPIFKDQIDAWEMVAGIPINIWEQHHFKVRNRASVQKEEADPGEILRRLDFSIANGDTVEAIKDMMRTIFLSPSAHKAVHNTWNDSDITNYAEHQRPWALRNQDNWNAWMDWLECYGYDRALFGSYADWLISLTH